MFKKEDPDPALYYKWSEAGNGTHSSNSKYRIDANALYSISLSVCYYQNKEGEKDS